MILCEWQGPHLDQQVVPNPTLEQVEAAVVRLNNARFNDLYLEPEDAEPGKWLCVGGGNGRYVLSGAEGEERYPTLVDPARPAEPAVTLVVGGQEGMYPANRVHALDTALDALRDFWTTGRFESEALTWING